MDCKVGGWLCLVYNFIILIDVEKLYIKKQIPDLKKQILCLENQRLYVIIKKAFLDLEER